MNKIFQIIYSNKFFAFAMLAVQVMIFAFSFNLFGGGFGIDWRLIQLIFTFISIGVIIYEVNRSTEPTFKITWLLIILIIPVFGITLYIFTRINLHTQLLQKRYEEVRRTTGINLLKDEEVYKELEETSPGDLRIITYLEKCSGSPVYKNTDVKYFSIGEDMLEDMKTELQTAKKFIFMEYFIINAYMNNTQNPHIWEEILEILKQKAKEGVEVRLLYDGMGCLTTLPKDYDKTIREMGIKCKIFSPIIPLISTHQNNRDHRKICVIDGRVAYTGGINLADEYANRIVRFGHWKDTGIKLVGEAVGGFCALFLEMWNLQLEEDSDEEIRKYIIYSRRYKEEDAKGYVIPFGDTPIDDDDVGKRVYIDILDNAKEYVHITTPYLVIDYEIYEAMKYATRRGVEVSIIMPHIPDKKYAFYLSRTYYPELLKAGVKIYEYESGFVHAKMSVGDGKKAMVGTVNHDFRSLYLHYECGALMIDAPAISDIEEDFQNMFKNSIKVNYEFYKSLPWYQRLYGQAIKLVAPLL